jgi:hypothetical protein
MDAVISEVRKGLMGKRKSLAPSDEGVAPRWFSGIACWFKSVAGVWLVWSVCAGSRGTIGATLPLVPALAHGAENQNRTGLDTEVIVKEKCKELIQCQKT